MHLSSGCTRFLCSALCLAAVPVAIPAAFAAALDAEQRSPVPNWDRELALQTVAMGKDEAALRSWLSLARSGRADELFLSIRKFGEATAISAPVREQALFLFVQSLADFSPELLPGEVLDYLAAWPLQTWVAHEESMSSAVPLFNIPAAVQGVRNGVEFRQAEARAAQILAGRPATNREAGADQWLAAYLAGSEIERRGFLNALELASREQLRQLGNVAQDHLAENAGLVVVAGRAALVTHDRIALQQILQSHRGPELANILREAATTLLPLDQVLLLLHAIETAPAENAALAIALLAPGLQNSLEVTESLFDLLEDPALGASAALALSHYSDSSVQQRLNTLAAGDTPESKRARLALGMAAPGESE